MPLLYDASATGVDASPRRVATPNVPGEKRVSYLYYHVPDSQ